MLRKSKLDFEFWYSFWKPWNDFIGDVQYFFNCIRRFFFWGWKMKENYDWGYGSIYEFLILKLPRMIKVFENDPYHHYSKQFMRRIRTVLVLAKRLHGEDYYYYADLHEKKWGKTEWNFKEKNEDGFYTNVLRDPDVVTDENREQYNKEFRRAVAMDTAQHKANKELFFILLKKYMETWID